MLQNVTNFLIQRLGDQAGPAAVFAAAAGAFVWLLGARFSKSILALVGVGVGAWVGVHLPQWYRWNFDGMALGMGGALLAGFAGYLLNTTWVGGALIANMGVLFGLTAWVIRAGDATWNMPASINWSGGQVEILRTLWSTMPGDLPQVMPYAVATGVICAMGLGILWPRLAKGMSWSLIGLTLILLGAGVALRIQRPGSNLSDYLPASPWQRVSALWGLAVLGMLLQWMMLPGKAAAAPAAESRRAPTPRRRPPAALAATTPVLATGGAKA
jgi:hypothetical protein